MQTIVLPTLSAMRERGTPFRGVLFAGLMLTSDGPKVVEFNCRFGDPEAQAVLPIMRGSLLETMLAIARGEPLGEAPLAWDGRYAVTTVVAAEGYPGTVRTGDEITLSGTRAEVLVFHAGTAKNANGALVTAGGRVLALTAVASTFAAAQAASKAAAHNVAFAGKQFRGDIGWREQQRNPGGTE
jgi:phosphoribosylamine--glycine ligase